MRKHPDKFIFKLLKGISYENAEYVFPLMQREIGEILKEIRSNDNIHKVIIFGSSVDIRCNSYSDIDLYVERYSSEKYCHFECGTPVDIVYEDCDDRLKEEIHRTGIPIYERGGINDV